MRIPNSFLTDFKCASDLKLACVFYSLIHKNTTKNMLGYEITAKQTTLAELCGCSVATVKRSVNSLRRLGFIQAQRRLSAGANKLGTYLYVVKCVPVNRSYFVMERCHMRRVSGNDFRVFALCCKLSDKRKSFYQSYSDLSELLSISRRDVIKSIEKLVKLKLIHKSRKRTKCGDFTDNTYIICRHVKHSKISSRKNVHKKTAPCLTHKGLSRCASNDRHTTSFNVNIHHFKRFVKSFFKKRYKNRKFFLDKGGG